MKGFRRRSVTAVMLAASMMLSTVSPVFAEGSKEFNEVPAESNVNEHPAHRPYFEWRQRMQFGEAGKNVVYVYANAGETIYFGSDVTKASDRSIEAIVHPEETFTNIISSSSKDWAGSSIAVTLPTEANSKTAFEPEKKDWTDRTAIEDLFRDGSELEIGCDTEKVYLFKPTPSGAGHILTPTQEEKGPNGVGGTTDGYEPLSFKAPVSGTYSFRFLAKDYNYEDVPHDAYKIDSQKEYVNTVSSVQGEVITAKKDGFLRYHNALSPQYGNDGAGERNAIQAFIAGHAIRNAYVGFDLSGYKANDIKSATLRMTVTDAYKGGNIHFYWLDYGTWTKDNMPSGTVVLDQEKMPTHTTSNNASFPNKSYHFVGDVSGKEKGDVFEVDMTTYLKDYLRGGGNPQFTLAMLAELVDEQSSTKFASIENMDHAGPQIVITKTSNSDHLDKNEKLSPVPESYTWDFTKMKSGGTYTKDTILGYGSAGTNGTDYDHYYYYDIEAQVGSGNNAKISTGNECLTLPNVSLDRNVTVSGITEGVLELLPAWAGTVSVTFSGRGSTVNIYQSNRKSTNLSNTNNSTKTVSLSVDENKPVYIYNTGSSSANITSITYTVTNPPTGAPRKISEQWATSIPAVVAAWDITVVNNNGAQSGRVWTDRLVLNAGGFKKSIYPQPKVLTKEGFLYDVKLNGIQPWAFSFYSNNRGFLLDRWSLYSNPQLAYGDETAQPSTDALQALEHSFFSKPVGGSGDMGPAPIRKEVDGNGGPVMNNGKQMESTILGNYVPVDGEKDVTHKLFFNEPDTVALGAYTDEGELKEIENADEAYNDLLSKINYIGLGNSANNTGDIHYGTIGIGGRFEVTIDADEAKHLKNLGSSSISILLDFSGYELDETGVPVPVLKSDGTWKAATSTPSTEEKNNLVSLSAVIDNAATEAKTYTLSWDGRDAYGNIVPKGDYSHAVKSFVEMGMAHFPLLDVEHNPNGIKIKMLNNIEGNNSTSDHVYYNNEAVSPRINPGDPSAWYYAGDLNLPYPSKIGDGLNKTGGISTNFDDSSKKGAMEFGNYSDADNGNDDYNDGLGYGNSTALDIWAKYEIKAKKEFSFGVAPIKPLRSYVSFVWIDKATSVEGTPFNVSHVNFAGERKETNRNNVGEDTLYGNTISTGFVTAVSTTAEGISNDYLTWEITIPAEGVANDEDTTQHASYIKIPAADIEDGEKATFTSQEDADEAEYLAYELFSSLFEDYAVEDEIILGEEFVPDWEADAGLNSDEEPGMLEIPDGALDTEISLSEDMYFEVMALEEDGVAGNYQDRDWNVTVNVEPQEVLADAEGVKVNKGKIHKINTFMDTATNEITVRLTHKIPIITGGSAVSVGLVIDNLYAPAATAIAKYPSNKLDAFHDITSILYGGSNIDSVQAATHDGYATSTMNEYNLDDISIDDINKNLLMHITFDETRKNNVSFEATVGGTVTVNNTGRSISYQTGKFGNAVKKTDDVRDSLELPKGIFKGLSSTSVSFWIKDTDTANTSGWAFMTTPAEMQTYLSEKYLGAKSDPEAILVERYFSNNQGRPDAASVTGLNFDNWTNITINFEPDTFSVYVNGMLSAGPVASKVTLDKLFTADARTWIGYANWNENSESFTGMIDDFRIYSRALSVSEIQKLYKESINN